MWGGRSRPPPLTLYLFLVRTPEGAPSNLRLGGEFCADKVERIGSCCRPQRSLEAGAAVEA